MEVIMSIDLNIDEQLEEALKAVQKAKENLVSSQVYKEFNEASQTVSDLLRTIKGMK
jgi:hypothetical protein